MSITPAKAGVQPRAWKAIDFIARREAEKPAELRVGQCARSMRFKRQAFNRSAGKISPLRLKLHREIPRKIEGDLHDLLRHRFYGGRAATDYAILTYLNLYGTNVTDAGLAHLKGLTYLRNLYVWQSKVIDRRRRQGLEGGLAPHGSFHRLGIGELMKKAEEKKK